MIPRLPILLTLMALLSSPGIASASQPTSDEIFAKLYCRYLARACSPDLQKVVGVNLADYPQKGGIPQRDLDRLSVDDKCLLALFWGLSLPLDGEKAELFGTFLGKDRVKVARHLQKIPEADLRDLCAGMGYPEGRASYRRKQIANWLDPKMSGWFNGAKNP